MGAKKGGDDCGLLRRRLCGIKKVNLENEGKGMRITVLSKIGSCNCKVIAKMVSVVIFIEL